MREKAIRVRGARQQSNVEGMLRDLSEVRIGDPVVHEQHGIGRYLGLVTLDAVVNGAGAPPIDAIDVGYRDLQTTYEQVKNALVGPAGAAVATAAAGAGGTGLGLTIAKMLTDLMGGSLRVNSQEGVGSCFSLRLPLEFAAAGETTEPRPVRALQPWAGPELKILLVEDNPVNMMIAAAMPESAAGRTTLSATSNFVAPNP